MSFFLSTSRSICKLVSGGFMGGRDGGRDEERGEEVDRGMKVNERGTEGGEK